MENKTKSLTLCCTSFGSLVQHIESLISTAEPDNKCGAFCLTTNFTSLPSNKKMPNIQLEMMREKYPNFMDCTIQLFDDTKSGRDLARKIDQKKFSKEDLERGLEHYNEKWAWVFFSINSMNPWERDKKNVTKVNAWACEVDDLSKEEQMKLISVAPLAPSLIIESNKSYHMYWFAKDGTIENWTKVCWWLRNFFWGDPAIASDISRVLRLPWYYHKKDITNPFMCNIVDGNWEYYTEEEMLKAFPDTETLADKEARAIKKEQQLKQAIWNDDTWDRIRAMDSKAMLEKISWTSLVWGDIISFKHNSNWTEQIFCNGKSTGCRIDKVGKIWSTDKGGPNWTNRIAWYGWVDWKEIYRWIKEEFPFILPEKKNDNSTALEITDEEIAQGSVVKTTEEKKGFLYPSEKFAPFEGFMSGDLVTVVAPSNSWKTTFALDILRRNAKLGRKWMYINLEFEIATVPRNRWLWEHWKWKMDLTDIGTMTQEEKEDMETYIQKYLSQFEYYNNPDGLELDKLISLIKKKAEEWFELFVIDTFSRILWNLNSDTARTNQNRSMEALQSLVQELNIAIILLHHTNKQGKFEGSQKIMDLSNVFIMIEKSDDGMWMPSRLYTLMKDKYTPEQELDLYYNVKTGEYLSNVNEVAEAKKTF